MKNHLKKNNFKLPLTILGVYEVIVIFLLSFDDLCIKTMCLFSRHRYCDFCEYHGFQYVLLCLLIPIIFGLLWWWRKDITKSVQYIKTNLYQDYCLNYQSLKFLMFCLVSIKKILLLKKILM